MFREEGGRPGDERGFLHKKLLGLVSKVSGFIPGPAGAIVSGFTGRLARRTLPRTTTARPSVLGEQGKQLGRDLKFGGTDLSIPRLTSPPLSRAAAGTGAPAGCILPWRWSRIQQRCAIFVGKDVGPNGDGGDGVRPRGPVGDAVMGQFGAALEPGVMQIERSVCLAGMQLAKDGLCYNKGAITNSQRMWPRGRRPLLTGGDMRAISIAARAGAKLDRTTKRLRSLGMMKALPRPRGGKAHAHAKPVAAVSV